MSKSLKKSRKPARSALTIADLNRWLSYLDCYGYTSDTRARFNRRFKTIGPAIAGMIDALAEAGHKRAALDLALLTAGTRHRECDEYRSLVIGDWLARCVLVRMVERMPSKGSSSATRDASMSLLHIHANSLGLTSPLVWQSSLAYALDNVCDVRNRLGGFEERDREKGLSTVAYFTRAKALAEQVLTVLSHSVTGLFQTWWEPEGQLWVGYTAVEALLQVSADWRGDLKALTRGLLKIEPGMTRQQVADLCDWPERTVTLRKVA